MDSQHVALAICATAAAYFLFKRRYSSSISDVPGPKNPSWVYGISASKQNNQLCLTNLGTGHPWWWQREDAAVVEKSILEEYGTIARWNACLGVRPFSQSPGTWRGPHVSWTITRNNACGSPTRRPSTIFSKALVLCMRYHP